MKPNNFLTFVFALIPGAGQMYLGMMKKGVSIMALFCGIIALIGFFRLDFLAMLLPVIWFYTFFDTFNTRSIPYEQRIASDKFMFGSQDLFKDSWQAVFEKRHRLLGGILIALGLYMLYQNVYSRFSYLIWEYIGHDNLLYRFIENIPTLLVSLLIIGLGIHLLRGRKNPKLPMLEQKNDYQEFGGEKDD